MAKRFCALLLALAMLLSFAACGETPADPTNPAPTNPAPTEPAPTEPAPTEPADPWAAYECITIAEALALCENFVENPSSDRYYIRATIKSVDNKTYGQMTIMDETGEIMVYGSSNADGSVRYDAMAAQPVAGDEVLLYGTLQHYKGNTKEVQNAWIIDFISKEQPEEPSQLPADGSELTIAELLALPVTDGVVTEQFYIVKATVESIVNAAYGQMWITDETGRISVYKSKAEDGTFYSNMTDKPYKGDTVTLKCNVKNFNGTMEVNQAYIIDFTHAEVTVDPAEYTEVTIAEAREAATGTKVKVSGVVAQLVYGGSANTPCGLILADATASVYVYDGDLAARCLVGNTITIAAEKTYWIQEKELDAARANGYKGCNQLADVKLIALDDSVTSFDASWVVETTVKEIMETSVDNDISTLIYKVTALIKRDASYGNWVNYYIDDLDGVTGSYCYTQCDGADYAWLDPYDGKICTIYMVALNAKCAADGCYWRFLPIEIISDEFDPASVNVPAYVVKYVGLKQFMNAYTGNPAKELQTSVDSEILGFAGASLHYESSDPSVISVADGVLNCLKSGAVTITVTGEYNGQTYSDTVTISVEIPQEDVEYPTVADVIAAAVDDTVIVKGIVGPSLVNKTGFYLVDETGVIAVLTTEDVMATLSIGQEVVMEGKRDRFHDSSKNGGTHAGQTCITDATVLVNNYGDHAYDTSGFVTDKTVSDLYVLDASVDYSTTVFVVTATVTKGSGQWATFGLTDGTKTLTLYSGSTVQYSWLEQFIGQEVTVQVAVCNWNNKNYWRGCVLAVTDAEGNIHYNTLNFN